MNTEGIVEGLAILTIIPGFGWLLITMFVFQNLAAKNGNKAGWLNFWPFYKAMKEAHPVGSKWARVFTYIGFVLCMPWIVWKFVGA